MKKRVTAMALALAMMFAITSSAFASVLRWNSTSTCTSSLFFTGTTANCKISVVADTGSSISGSIILYRVSSTSETKVASWNVSGTSRLTTTKTIGVTAGQTYIMVIDINVSGANGKDHITDSITKTC